MRNSEAKNIPDSLGNYYASNRATAIINYNKYNKNISQDREIGPNNNSELYPPLKLLHKLRYPE